MKLSVVMITYNHERFIAQAIESVLAQNVNFDYEIVIAEDCSTDGTRAVILDFQRRAPNRIVTLLRDHNIGAMRNFAGAIEACRGQYLAILEGDDYWSCVDKLQRQVDFLDAHPGWAICCSRAEVRNDGDGNPRTTRAQSGTVFPARPVGAQSNRPDYLGGLLPVTQRASGTYALEDILRENFIPTCTVVYRWNNMKSFPMWFLRSSLGDLPLHAMVLGEMKIELLDECMAVYRIHAGGMWSSRDRNSQILENARMLAALNRHLNSRYDNILGPIISESYLSAAMTARERGRRLETGRHLIRCIRHGGWRLPATGRLLAGLGAYTLIGSGYKIFSRAKAPNGK